MKITTFDYWSLGECTIILEDEKRIESSNLADFLFLFRGVYAAGMQIAGSIDRSRAEVDPAFLADEVRKHLQTLTVFQIDDLFREDLGANSLLTERISHDSPTRIVLCGSMIFIAAAVGLSGGTIELGLGPGTLKANLAPMGDGIKCLREALTSRTGAPIGYGIKSRRVSLSKEEFTLLMRQNPETKRKGGFQRLLVELQAKVNRKTRKLELSEKDIDRILRAGKHRKVGGFQGRVYKIFERHFDFSEEN